MADSEQIRSRYTMTQRLFYNLKRYLVFMVILAPALIWLYYVDPTKTESSLLVLLTTRIARSTTGVCLAMLFMKFAFPKMALQEEIVTDQNISAALIFAAIVIATCL